MAGTLRYYEVHSTNPVFNPQVKSVEVALQAMCRDQSIEVRDITDLVVTDTPTNSDDDDTE
jgi:hypothetical protein